jgi:signal transduction histidine kinase
MLGLGLVIAIMTLLLAGTLKGLMAFRATMRSIDSKLTELQEAEDLKLAVNDLKQSAADRPLTPDKLAALLLRLNRAQEVLALYQEKLHDTLEHRRDPDKGYQELRLIEALNERFGKLSQAVHEAHKALFKVTPNLGSEAVQDDARVEAAIDDLVRTSEDLNGAIYEDLFNRSTDAKGHYKSSLVIVISTSVVGVVLMAGLLRFFYRWVFYPVRDLERGVGQVAQGDFDHRIEVHSGDEMEDLAAAFNDMTGRLREMYTDLARQVNERSRQLVRSERLAGIGFLAAGVAHEINNPLASIAFCSEALESRLADVLDQATPDKEVIRKYLKMIQQEAFRCKAITQRLLQFSRGGERHREPTDMAELTQSVLDMVQHLETSKGKRIVFETHGKLLAWVNGQEIKSVVLNLVVNALDSMDEGGTLTITLGQRDRRAELVFADTGCGMTPEILENIFEPFFTRSRTGKGTGLGLSISHRVINQHGGEIEAVSPGPNQGSTFTVRLPLVPAEPVKEDTFGHAAA